MKAGETGPSEPAWQYAVAGGLMLGGPVWHYLYVSRYPVDRPEAVILPLVAGLLGAAIATPGRRIGGVAGDLMFGALLFAFVDLQLDLQRWIRTLLVIAGCFGLARVFRSRRAILACVMLGGFYLASLPRPAAAPAPAALGRPTPAALAAARASPRRDNPMLVHVVLDEQWGIGGLRAAGDSATAAFLTDFYLRHGFEVYEAAYSRWQRTSQAIPDLMSFGRPLDVQAFGGSGSRIRLRSNPYFERLRELGYAVYVYQSSYVDFCRSDGVAVASCEEAAGNSIANIGYLPGAWTTRAVLSGRHFLNRTSHVYARLRLDEDPTWGRSFAGRGLEQLRSVREAVAAGPHRGITIFVHLLLPHRPLEVGDDCRAYRQRPRVGPWILGDSNIAPWGKDSPRPRAPHWPPHLGDSIWRARVAQYSAQVRCVHGKMGLLLAAIDSTVGRDGAVIIVQGDHGSRMSQDTPTQTQLSSLDAQQLNSSFSTLLAVRRPRVPAALRAEPVPVQDFLWELAGNGFEGKVGSEWQHYVRRAPMGPDPKPTDTLRTLSLHEMLWARPLAVSRPGMRPEGSPAPRRPGPAAPCSAWPRD